MVMMILIVQNLAFRVTHTDSPFVWRDVAARTFSHFHDALDHMKDIVRRWMEGMDNIVC